MSKHTPGPWFVSGVRFRMNGSEWLSINRYDETKKQDENIACVGFDPRDGTGTQDARLIAAAPEMLEALKNLLAVKNGEGGTAFDSDEIARAAIAKAEGEAA
jgi:hypothetical protein